MSIRIHLRTLLASAAVLGISGSAFAQEAMPAISSSQTGRPVSVNSANRALNDLFLNQWVQARASGELIGRVMRVQGDAAIPAGGFRVSVVQNGQLVSDTMSDGQGAFSLSNVGPGHYTIVSRSDNSIGSFSLVVLAPEAGRHLPADVTIPVATVVGGSLQTIMAASRAPGQNVDLNQRGFDGDPLGENRIPAGRDCEYVLKADGSLEGRISRPGTAPMASDLANTTVQLFENGREIGRTKTDVNGVYSFANLRPGAYGLVASGRPGFLAFGFCAVAYQPELSSNTLLDGSRFVAAAAQSGDSGSLNGEPGEPTDEDDRVLVPDDQGLALVPDQLGGFPAGGGAPLGGAGAGGLGGGGLGGLAAIGALAAVGAAIASDDNNDNVVPPINTATPNIIGTN